MKHLGVGVGGQCGNFILSFGLEVKSEGQFVDFASCNFGIKVFLDCDILTSWGPFIFLFSGAFIGGKFADEYFLPLLHHFEIPFDIAYVQSYRFSFLLIVLYGKIKPILMSVGVCVYSQVQVVFIFLHPRNYFQVSCFHLIPEWTTCLLRLLNRPTSFIFRHDKWLFHSLPEESVIFTVEKVFLLGVLIFSKEPVSVGFLVSFEN